jgi:hypothetical protein
LFFLGKILIFPKNLRRLANSKFLRRIQKKSDGEKERKFVNGQSDDDGSPGLGLGEGRFARRSQSLYWLIC